MLSIDIKRCIKYILIIFLLLLLLSSSSPSSFLLHFYLFPNLQWFRQISVIKLSCFPTYANTLVVILPKVIFNTIWGKVKKWQYPVIKGLRAISKRFLEGGGRRIDPSPQMWQLGLTASMSSRFVMSSAPSPFRNNSYLKNVWRRKKSSFEQRCV